MLKSFVNGVGGGFGRLIGKVIGIGLIGYLAYRYAQNNDINIENKINNITEGIFYEKN